jgi:hypothetical protein
MSLQQAIAFETTNCSNRKPIFSYLRSTCVATKPQPEPPSLPAKFAIVTPFTEPPLPTTQSISALLLLLLGWLASAAAAAAAMHLLVMQTLCCKRQLLLLLL